MLASVLYIVFTQMCEGMFIGGCGPSGGKLHINATNIARYKSNVWPDSLSLN